MGSYCFARSFNKLKKNQHLDDTDAEFQDNKSTDTPITLNPHISQVLKDFQHQENTKYIQFQEEKQIEDKQDHTMPQEVQVKERKFNQQVEDAKLKMEEIKQYFDENDFQFSVQQLSEEQKQQLKLVQKNLDEIYEIFDQYLDPQLDIDDISQLYFYQAITLQNLNDYDQALFLYDQIQQIFKNQEDKTNVGVVLNNIGNIHYALGDYKKSEKYHLKALKYRKKLKNLSFLIQTYTNLGNIYIELDESQKQLSCMQKQMEYLEKIKPIDYNQLGMTYHDYGLVLMYTGNYSLSQNAFQQALQAFELFQEEKGFQRDIQINIGFSLYCLGMAQQYDRKFVDAIKSYRQSEQIYIDNDVSDDQVDQLNNIKENIQQCQSSLKQQKENI